jgi:hypothetical protein
VASPAMAASCAQVTSSWGMGTPTTPRDRRCRGKIKGYKRTQRKPEASWSYRFYGEFSSWTWRLVAQFELEYLCHVIQLELDVCCHIVQLKVDAHLIK